MPKLGHSTVRKVGKECPFCGDVVRKLDAEHCACGCGTRNTIRA